MPHPERPGEDTECIEYHEHGSKNRPGGRHQLNLTNKVVVQYSHPELGSRCHVYLLRLYLSKLPEIAFQRDIFYWKALDKVPDSADQPWYSRSVVGHNTRDKYLKQMLEAASIESKEKTNHSLRATAITRMMEKNVPAKLIMERSGHLTEGGLSPYERSTPLQRVSLCRALTDITNSNTSEANSTVVETSVFSHEGKISVPVGKDVAAEKCEKKPDPSDLTKGLHFQNMQGCTFNISFKA